MFELITKLLKRQNPHTNHQVIAQMLKKKFLETQRVIPVLNKKLNLRVILNLKKMNTLIQIMNQKLMRIKMIQNNTKFIITKELNLRTTF